MSDKVKAISSFDEFKQIVREVAVEGALGDDSMASEPREARLTH